MGYERPGRRGRKRDDEVATDMEGRRGRGRDVSGEKLNEWWNEVDGRGMYCIPHPPEASGKGEGVGSVFGSVNM